MAKRPKAKKSKRIGTKKRRALVDALIERDGTECTWCCRPMVDEPIFPWDDCTDHMTLEHVLPLSEGGTNELWNLALACFGCNNGRGSSLDWSCEVATDTPGSCVL